ncbi:MAG: tetratricopeptide repeat protein [bacterium]|nr:tetratricopeptide repeat protein [bacterium]
MQDATNDAIRAALTGKWAEAIKINKEILKESPNNLETLNRLTRAYIELNQKNLALKTVREALRIDPYNQISQKLKAKIGTSGHGFVNNDSYASISAFIEEPGKTRTVILINCAPPKKIRCTECTQGLTLVPKKHTTHVCDCDGNYLGMLPDDLGKRLNLLIKGGNTYTCFVKSVSDKGLSIFIREITRVKKYKDIPSFPAKIVSDHLIDNADQILKDEEDRQHKTKKVVEEPADDEDDLQTSKSIHQDEEPEE